METDPTTGTGTPADEASPGTELHPTLKWEQDGHHDVSRLRGAPPTFPKQPKQNPFVGGVISMEVGSNKIETVGLLEHEGQ